jgi:group II intron reverse transcriptase/maturase
MDENSTSQTQSWIAPTRFVGTPRDEFFREDVFALERVREAAKKDKHVKFTALMHHITKERLRSSFEALNPRAAPGVDCVEVGDYKEELEDNIDRLWQRVQGGSYKPLPSKRSYIPKGDGRMRPLGIAALEDKIVQRTVSELLSAIYEVDFKGFSYGFRPDRNCHSALDALYMAITTRKVNYVLDADIQGYFDSISHDWMIRFLEHRIADRRIIRLAEKWLAAGVIDGGELVKTEEGTPQGSSISPLFSNIYLHYVLDLWVDNWRKKEATGEVYIVRYADDFMVCFQYKTDAIRFQTALRERLNKFDLTLNLNKTKLIEFGRFAAGNRRKRDEKKPETFDFLGFTHICGITSKTCRFKLLRITTGKRWRAKVKILRIEMRSRINDSIKEMGKWLRRVLQGYYNYYSIHDNLTVLNNFRYQVALSWLKVLNRRSHKAKMKWDYKFAKIVNRWLPSPKVVHPYPNERFNAFNALSR